MDEEKFQRSKQQRLGIKPPTPDPVNELVDISSMSDAPSSRPDVETQLETLKAI
jgi:hypothetical protein